MNLLYYILWVVALSFFKNLNRLYGVLSLIYISILSLIYISYTFDIVFFVSSWYQIVGLLNTRDNIVIIIIYLFFLKFNTKNSLQNKFLTSNLVVTTTLLFYNISQYTWSQLNISYNIGVTNTNLVNGIMLVHPHILYTYYASLFCISFTLYFLSNQKKKKNFMALLFTGVYNQLFLILFATVLGCYWAEQELLWGGWWSWDFVELLALNLIIISLYAVHSSVNTPCKYKNLYLYIIYALFLNILFVRYNIINSVHNFVTNNTQNQYDYYIVVTVMFLLLGFFKILNGYLYKTHNYVSTNIVVLLLLLSINILFLVFLKTTVVLLLPTYKNTLVVILLIIGVVVCFNKNKPEILVLFLFSVYITTIDVFILCVCIFLVKRYIFKKITYVHLSILIVCIYLNYQVGLFAMQQNNTFFSKIFFLKHNSYQIIDISVLDSFLFKRQIFCLENIFWEDSFFKKIFEKNILWNGHIYEIYNYNYQIFHQNYLPLLFFGFFIKLFSIFQKINNIVMLIKI